MKILSKIGKGIINIIFYPFLAAIVAVLILFLCGIRPYITMSGSMEPEIQTGSICFVNTRAKYEDIQEGNVIAYEIPNGGLVTHRVISISEAGMETKGDANAVSDGITTTPNNFHGKTVFSVPRVGYVLKYLQQPQGVAIILIAVVGIMVVTTVDSFLLKDEEQQEPKDAT